MNENLYQKYYRKLKCNYEHLKETQKPSVCRICMAGESTNIKLHLIPWSEWENNEMFEGFKDITGIQFNINEQYPEYICEKCIDWLNETNKMIQHFQEIDQFWNLYIMKNETIQNHVTDVKEFTEIEYLLPCSDSELKIKSEDTVAVFMDSISSIDDSSEKNHIKYDTNDDHDTNYDDNNVENESNFEFINVIKNDQPVTRKKCQKLPKPIKKIKLKLTECPYCKLKFRTFIGCENHIREWHNPSYNREGELICEYCDLSLPIKLKLVEHMKLFHRGYNKHEYYCKLCEKYIFNETAYKTHIRLHLCTNIFECDICKRIFLSKKVIRVHMGVHSSELGPMCDACGLVLKSINSLRRHKRNKHPSNGEIKSTRRRKVTIPPECRQYSCSLCDRRLGTMQSLQYHMFTKHRKTGSQEFKILSKLWCIKCNLILNDLNKVVQHRKEFHVVKSYDRILATSDRQFPKLGYFQCDICKQYLCSEETLKTHKLVHPLKDRPFKCMECGASYTRKTHLKQHFNRSHSTERPFECNQCEWKFSNKYELSMHIRIVHMREMKYVCDICECAFTTSSGLKTHRISKHTKEYRFTCNICDRKFLTAQTCNQHKRVHNKKEISFIE